MSFYWQWNFLTFQNSDNMRNISIFCKANLDHLWCQICKSEATFLLWVLYKVSFCNKNFCCRTPVKGCKTALKDCDKSRLLPAVVSKLTIVKNHIVFFLWLDHISRAIKCAKRWCYYISLFVWLYDCMILLSIFVCLYVCMLVCLCLNAWIS